MAAPNPVILPDRTVLNLIGLFLAWETRIFKDTSYVPNMSGPLL